MQPTTLIMAASLLTGQSYAISCTNGGIYCGSNLAGGRGFSFSDIQTAYLREPLSNGPAPLDSEIWGSLFKCHENGNHLEWISGRKQCGYCQHNGDGGDYCK